MVNGSSSVNTLDERRVNRIMVPQLLYPADCAPDSRSIYPVHNFKQFYAFSATKMQVERPNAWPRGNLLPGKGKKWVIIHSICFIGTSYNIDSLTLNVRTVVRVESAMGHFYLARRLSEKQYIRQGNDTRRHNWCGKNHQRGGGIRPRSFALNLLKGDYGRRQYTTNKLKKTDPWYIKEVQIHASLFPGPICGLLAVLRWYVGPYSTRDVDERLNAV